MEYRINGFEQIKAFYSWVFNNQDKRVNTTHISLYMFLVNQNNRSNWVEWFKLPYDLGMTGAMIGSRNTYYKCLADLKEWKLIEYKPGVNNWKAPIVKLCLLKSDTTTEQVPVPLSEQLPEPLTIQLTEQLPEHIYKLLTNNLKLITDNIEGVIDFLEKSPPKKPRAKSKPKKPAHPAYKLCISIYNEFMKKHSGAAAMIDGVQGKAMNTIIAKLEKEIKVENKTPEAIADAFKTILDKHSLWEKWRQANLKLNQISSELGNIMADIKKANKKVGLTDNLTNIDYSQKNW